MSTNHVLKIQNEYVHIVDILFKALLREIHI